MKFYKRFTGDYGRDTAHLSLAEHGAYTLLLDHYYSLESALPNDMTALYRICRAFDKKEQEAVRNVTAQFFQTGEDGLLHNPRADAVIETDGGDGKQANANRINGLKGGRPRKQKPTEQEPQKNPLGFESETQSEPIENLSHSQSHINPSGSSSGSSNSTTFGAGEKQPLPPLSTPSEQVQRIGYVCRLLRSKGVNCSPAQFQGKYRGLENHADDDFHMAVQTLQDRGEQSIGIGLVAAVLGDIVQQRKQGPVTYTPRHGATGKPQQFDPTAYVNRNRISKQQPRNDHDRDSAIDGECERVA